MRKFTNTLPIVSSWLHSTYSKSYTVLYDQFNEAIYIPQKWIEDIKQVEFSELLATSIGPLAIFFSWKKRQKEEFSELASGVLASSFIHGDPIGSITSIVVLAYRYNQTSNKQELRKLKWRAIKGSICVITIVRKSVSTLRFWEYLNFIRSLKFKMPKLKRKISRREFISLKIFEPNSA
jgi:hypothetical protein